MIMKKYFIFAAIATAGLFASCSSSDDVISGNPNDIQNPDGDRVAIVLNVGSNASTAVTRGSGTVGAVQGQGDNFWASQKINVFMFKDGTTDLATDGNEAIYDNTELTTPTGVTSGVAEERVANAPANDPGNTHVKHRYYPMTGNQLYDFWGYHVDGCATGAYTNTNGIVKVPFKIDGSQDLMAAKTRIKEWDNTDATKNYTDAEKDAMFGGHDAAAKDKYDVAVAAAYSAKAARNGLQPDLLFKHLLTRFTFVVKGGNYDACGWADATTPPAEGQHYTGVFIKSIELYSETTGDIVAAYNTASATTYENNDGVIAGKLTDWESGAGVKSFLALKSATKWAGLAANEESDDEFYTDVEANAANALLFGAVAADAAVPADYEAKVGQAAAGETLTADEANAYNATLIGAVTTADIKTPAKKNGWLKPLYDFDINEAALVVDADDSDNTHWTSIIRPQSSDPANWTQGDGTPVGSALMVKPNEANYRIRVVLGQYLLDREEKPVADPLNPTHSYIVKTTVLDSETNPALRLTAPTSTDDNDKFAAGKSYKVILTVYGFEEIKITTSLDAWVAGADVPVTAE